MIDADSPELALGKGLAVLKKPTGQFLVSVYPIQGATGVPVASVENGTFWSADINASVLMKNRSESRVHGSETQKKVIGFCFSFVCSVDRIFVLIPFGPIKWNSEGRGQTKKTFETWLDDTSATTDGVRENSCCKISTPPDADGSCLFI
mmetsp:Transcript_26254/g.37381  ORF Transcript_26254/g.37381 Transcript_26254/m.37381 type:complete len:149 (-) Transcript_26254:205-651(-)